MKATKSLNMSKTMAPCFKNKEDFSHGILFKTITNIEDQKYTKNHLTPLGSWKLELGNPRTRKSLQASKHTIALPLSLYYKSHPGCSRVNIRLRNINSNNKIISINTVVVLVQY